MAKVVKLVKKFVDCVNWVVVDQHPHSSWNGAEEAPCGAWIVSNDAEKMEESL